MQKNEKTAQKGIDSGRIAAYNSIKHLNECSNDKSRKGIGIMKKTYRIEVDCANCANKMEQTAQKTEGVKRAVVNFMALKMIVEFEEGADPKAVMQQVKTNCKRIDDDFEIEL